MAVTLLRKPASFAAIASAVLTAGTLVGAALAPTAAAQPCPDVEVIFARGTSEEAGPGRVGVALAEAMKPLLGTRTVTLYGVNYPAGRNFLTTAEGATDASNRITQMATACPNTKIVLGGYSQGAAVVDMLGGIPPLGNKIGEIGSAPPLTSSAAARVSAVAVFGNPATKFGNPVSASGLFVGKAIDLCNDGDPICSDGRNPFAHTNYEDGASIGQAAGFVATRV